jgi:hypothetical protein
LGVAWEDSSPPLSLSVEELLSEGSARLVLMVLLSSLLVGAVVVVLREEPGMFEFTV